MVWVRLPVNRDSEVLSDVLSATPCFWAPRTLFFSSISPYLWLSPRSAMHPTSFPGTLQNHGTGSDVTTTLMFDLLLTSGVCAANADIYTNIDVRRRRLCVGSKEFMAKVPLAPSGNGEEMCRWNVQESLLNGFVPSWVWKPFCFGQVDTWVLRHASAFLHASPLSSRHREECKFNSLCCASVLVAHPWEHVSYCLGATALCVGRSGRISMADKRQMRCFIVKV